MPRRNIGLRKRDFYFFYTKKSFFFQGYQEKIPLWPAEGVNGRSRRRSQVARQREPRFEEEESACLVGSFPPPPPHSSPSPTFAFVSCVILPPHSSRRKKNVFATLQGGSELTEAFFQRQTVLVLSAISLSSRFDACDALCFPVTTACASLYQHSTCIAEKWITFVPGRLSHVIKCLLKTPP